MRKRGGGVHGPTAVHVNSPGLSPSGTTTGLAFRARYVLFVPWMLMVVHVLNYLDRQVINVLAEPMKQDLHLSDTQLGLVTGFAFAVFYTLVGIPFGRLIDNPRSNRVGIISIALGAWSAMTLVCGLARTFAQLLLARIGVAVFESACTPAAHSLIGESVPNERRARALAIYGLGIPIGSLFGKALGGQLADAFGWRRAFMIVGAPGLVVAIISWLFLKEPRRRSVATVVQRSVSDQVAQISAAVGDRIGLKALVREICRSRALVCIIAAATTQQFLVAAISVWGMVFFIRMLEVTPGQAGLWIGLTGGIAGSLGTWLGGFLADRFGPRNPRHYMTPAVVGMILSVPFYFLAWTSNYWIAVLFLVMVPDILDNLYYGGTFASLQALVRPQVRATATALLLFVQILIGTGVGSLAFGFASDLLVPFAGGQSLRWVLIGSAFLFVVPAFLFWRAGVHLQRELPAIGPEPQQLASAG